MSAQPGNGLRGSCERCGAALRRGHPGKRCDPCSGRRDIVEVAEQLREAEFFTREAVQRALAASDFGYLFRAVRRTVGLTQIELGELLEMDQGRISRIECGEHRLRDFETIVRVASRLGIPPVLLGFSPNAATVERSQTSKNVEKVDWMRRRNFSWAAAGTLLGLSIPGLDIDRLAALLPAEPTPVPRRIGAADVAAIEHATESFRGLGFSHGGALCRPATVAQFHSVLELRDAICTEQVRQRLLVATADLGSVAAWANYDAERHNDARHLWLAALNIAGQAKHPQAGNLTAHLLMHMTHQALHLRQPEEACNLVQLAYNTTTRHNQPLPASTASYLASHQAWAQAAQRDARSCDYALGQATEQFTHVDPATAEPWAGHITANELAAYQGHISYTLALSTADPKHATQAVPLLMQAVEGFGPAYARLRASILPGLAGSHAILGDLDAAARTSHQAVAEITTLTVPRLYDKLRTLHTVLAPHHNDPAIGEVREKIQTALTVV